MTLEEFGQELRAQRAARNVSLIDIAAETRINQKFLEAIERGAFSVLPQAYIRAFLREYASAVGLSPDDVLLQYENAGGAASPVPVSKPEPHAPAAAPAPAAGGPSIPAALRPYVVGALVLLAIAVAALMLINGAEPSTPVSTGEMPFDRVIRETEAAMPVDSLPRFATAPPVRAVTVDSLTLEITTIDSVWINIVVDERTAEDYLFAPDRRRTWKARERFMLTMGNAGGATFRLNGKELGALGRRGAVLRNSLITADLLR
ncbi:MAG: helix-turn-helix domain-containing protein [Bacteroidetes bacterium]|jgi:transcriptional regulator with XRE-family HTH domain|nr:helix-turn-helix domain-containing protein [Bacteroidota bacterium]